METTCRHHFNKIFTASITSNASWYDALIWKQHCSAVFPGKMHNLSLIMRKDQVSQKEQWTHCEVTELYVSKYQGHERQKKIQGTISYLKRRMRHDNCKQCLILDWILDQK